MADSTIPNSFKVAFDDQCKLVYQDRGGRLRQCVRSKQTDGTEETFYRLGKGEAKDKERGAKVPRLNLDRIPTKVKLAKNMLQKQSMTLILKFRHTMKCLKSLSQLLWLVLVLKTI